MQVHSQFWIESHSQILCGGWEFDDRWVDYVIKQLLNDFEVYILKYFARICNTIRITKGRRQDGIAAGSIN